MSSLDSTVSKQELQSVLGVPLDTDIKGLFRLSIFHSKPSVTLREIAETDNIEVSRRIELLMHWLSEDERKRLAHETADRVVRRATDFIFERDWLSWADRWLGKDDRTLTSAREASAIVQPPGAGFRADQVVAHLVMMCCCYAAQGYCTSTLSSGASALSIMEAIKKTQPDSATIAAMAYHDRGYAASAECRAFEKARREAEKLAVIGQLESVVGVLSQADSRR